MPKILQMLIGRRGEGERSYNTVTRCSTPPQIFQHIKVIEKFVQWSLAIINLEFIRIKQTLIWSWNCERIFFFLKCLPFSLLGECKKNVTRLPEIYGSDIVPALPLSLVESLLFRKLSDRNTSSQISGVFAVVNLFYRIYFYIRTKNISKTKSLPSFWSRVFPFSVFFRSIRSSRWRLKKISSRLNKF